MKTYDLIENGNGIDVMSEGNIEHFFELSLLVSDTIKMTKVHTSNGETIVLRYSYNPETEHLNHTAKRYEEYISKHYQRIER